MKKLIAIAAALSLLAATGCKSKMQKYQELSDKYALAETTTAADCPMVQDAQGSYQINKSPKCVEERNHNEALHQQLLDAQREASQ